MKDWITELRPEKADYLGQFGESNAPDNCTECGAYWSSSERLHTGDVNGIGGWEDWMYCAACGCDMFFPVTRVASEIGRGMK